MVHLDDTTCAIFLRFYLDFVSGIAANTRATGLIVCIAILIDALTSPGAIDEHPYNALLAFPCGRI
jgi:hypothetical protein